MKRSSIIFLLFLALSGYGQDTLTLIIDNPEPRVGDVVQISFNIDFLVDHLREQTVETIEFTKPLFATNNTFTQSIKFTREGKSTIGPYQFEFNNKQYVSTSIEVNVEKELPYQDGLWVRYVRLEEKQYLIVEQLISNQSDYKTEENGFSYTVGGISNEDYAELTEVPLDGVRFQFKGSKSNTRRPEGDDLFAPGYSYSIKRYEVIFEEGYKGKFKLEKEHIKNFPKNTKFKPILIKS